MVIFQPYDATNLVFYCLFKTRVKNGAIILLCRFTKKPYGVRIQPFDSRGEDILMTLFVILYNDKLI